MRLVQMSFSIPASFRTLSVEWFSNTIKSSYFLIIIKTVLKVLLKGTPAICSMCGLNTFQAATVFKNTCLKLKKNSLS